MELNRKIVEICQQNPTDFEARNYSGRGMYGRECLGVVVSDSSKIFLLGAHLGEYAFDISDICFDRMGLRHIIYFPRLEYMELEEEEEGDIENIDIDW